MVRDVQPDHVHSYIHTRVNEGQENESEPSNATKRSRYRHVRAFFSWAVEVPTVVGTRDPAGHMAHRTSKRIVQTIWLRAQGP